MAQGKSVLIIDDDDDLRAALAEQIDAESDLSASQAPTGAEGLALAAAARPDLILLDIDLPDMNGRDVCRRLRDEGVRAPIVMLTGQNSDADTVAGLDAGADDYVAKPFRIAVLLARIRAQLRAHEQSEHAVFHIGRFEFRPAQKVLIDPHGKSKVRLTEKETSILKYLYRAGGQPVGREELLTEVWGYNAGVTTHTLETHIYRLRQKVDSDGEKLLVTEGGGYRLQV